MSYPRNLLAPGEEVIREMRPHWRSLIVPSIYLILTAVAGIYLYTNTQWQWFRYALLGVAAIILIFWVIRPFLNWVTTEYVFTTRRIITRQGFIAKSGIDVPLAKVNNVSFDISVLGRIMNFGDLKIESANSDSDLRIDDVPNVEHVQRLIYTLQEDESARQRGD